MAGSGKLRVGHHFVTSTEGKRIYDYSEILKLVEHPQLPLGFWTESACCVGDRVMECVVGVNQFCEAQVLVSEQPQQLVELVRNHLCLMQQRSQISQI